MSFFLLYPYIKMRNALSGVLESWVRRKIRERKHFIFIPKVYMHTY